jgi:hypothetical protein
MTHIKLEFDRAGHPVSVEYYSHEGPKAKTIHSLREDIEGAYVSDDGKRWSRTISHYRPDPKSDDSNTFPTKEALAVWVKKKEEEKGTGKK